MNLPSADHVQRSMIDAFAEPVFVITADVDWASDDCIDDLVTWLNGCGIKPTLFLTHQSQAINQMVDREQVETGYHPNFLPGSSHGCEIGEVLDAVGAFPATLPVLRSHSHVESSPIFLQAAARGIRFDSNNCLHLQPHIYPARHWTGIWRLPAFWEDDVHWTVGGVWDLSRYRDLLFTPGLKIFDIHPVAQALNIPSADFYQQHRHRSSALSAQDIREYRHAGAGARSFMEQVVEAVQKSGREFTSLGFLLNKVGDIGSSDLQRGAA